jgi:hypothetical protein
LCRFHLDSDLNIWKKKTIWEHLNV